MKKVLIGIISLIFIGQFAIAQPVSDNAVIPMGITVSHVLRLNVVSGGNIEFVFSSVYDFQNGLAGDMYRTNLTVESSTNWGLSLYASDFSGSAGAINVNAVDFGIQDNLGANTVVTAAAVGVKRILCNLAGLYTVAGTGTFRMLANGTYMVLQETGTGNDGTAAANNFYIRWRCGIGPTSLILPNGSGSGLINSYAVTPGRSATNVVISLSSRP